MSRTLLLLALASCFFFALAAGVPSTPLYSYRGSMAACMRDDSTGEQGCERDANSNGRCIGATMHGRSASVYFECGTAYLNNSVWRVRSTSTVYTNSSDCTGETRGPIVDDDPAPTDFGLWDITGTARNFESVGGNVSVSWARACSVRLDEPAAPLPPLPLGKNETFAFLANTYSVCVAGAPCSKGALTQEHNELCVNASSGGKQRGILLYCPPLTYLDAARGWQVGAIDTYYPTSATCGRALSESGTWPQHNPRVAWGSVPTKAGQSVKIAAAMPDIDGITWSLECGVAVHGPAQPGSGGDSNHKKVGLAVGLTLGFVALIALVVVVVKRRRQANEGHSEFTGGHYQATA